MRPRLIPIAVLVLTFISGATLVAGDSTNGSFTFTVAGYTVSGSLSSASIAHGGAVQMVMTIDQNVPTSYGTVHVTGSGVWSGQTDFQTVSGVIGNLGGTIQACFLFSCQDGDFAGTGTWSGTLSPAGGGESQGSGMFQGTVNISGLPSQNGPATISGSWTSTFET